MFFFFNDTATTEIYTLSLHDALPIWARDPQGRGRDARRPRPRQARGLGDGRQELRDRRRRRRPRRSRARDRDRKSTRLNSSHANISYAVFCLKKKKKTNIHILSHTNK